MATTKLAQKTDWVKIKPEEVEKLVIELGKQNIPPEKIGLILRDQHGIPKVKVFNKRIKKILKEANLWKDSEYENTVKKLETLKKHLEKNKHDYKAKCFIMKYTARLNKLKKFALK